MYTVWKEVLALLSEKSEIAVKIILTGLMSSDFDLSIE